MKGAIRMAAIMECPSIFVFTHDSIGLGEDGPTHQPIEQLVHLRAVPKLNVVRPADFNETQLAWRFAMRSTNRPTAFSLSRQGAPNARPGRGSRRRDRARRLRAARHRRRPRRDPDRHRHRGVARARGGRRARRRADGARRLDAVHGHLQRAGRRVPRLRAAAGREGARGGRGREPVQLAPLGRRRRRDHRDDGLRRVRSGARGLRALRHHRREASPRPRAGWLR